MDVHLVDPASAPGRDGVEVRTDNRVLDLDVVNGLALGIGLHIDARTAAQADIHPIQQDVVRAVDGDASAAVLRDGDPSQHHLAGLTCPPLIPAGQIDPISPDAGDPYVGDNGPQQRVQAQAGVELHLLPIAADTSGDVAQVGLGVGAADTEVANLRVHQVRHSQDPVRLRIPPSRRGVCRTPEQRAAAVEDEVVLVPEEDLPFRSVAASLLQGRRGTVRQRPEPSGHALGHVRGAVGGYRRRHAPHGGIRRLSHGRRAYERERDGSDEQAEKNWHGSLPAAEPGPASSQPSEGNFVWPTFVRPIGDRPLW